MRRALLAALVGLLAACRPSGGPPPGAGSADDPFADARLALDAGRPDDALARLQGRGEPEALLLQGQAWARKAAAAPVPTPLPGGEAAPEFKPEESRAIEFLERAAEARPDDGAPRLALAELLAPHALERLRRESGRKKTRDPEPAASGGVSVERVLHSYHAAVQAERAGTVAVDALIAFATAAGRLADADSAFQELLKRDKESAAPHVRYGDFLAGARKDPAAAVAQYEQALIWKPGDPEARAKIADIYLDLASGHVARQEYATADARLRDARRYAGGPSTPQGRRLEEQVAILQQIRERVGR